MQLFLGAVPIILRLFSKARGHLLFSNYSWNNLPKPTSDAGVYQCIFKDTDSTREVVTSIPMRLDTGL